MALSTLILALSGDAHTLLSHFLPSERLTSVGKKILVDLGDGDRLCGFLHRGYSDCVVSLFHGLSGDIDADYMQRTALRYLALGHSVFLVNHRGVGEEGAALAKLPYHSGRGEDISQVVATLRELFPNKKQITVGFSMSGNMVLTLLTGQRGRHLPDGAIVVNAPIQLQASSILLGQGLNRIYDLRFVRRLREQKKIQISPWSRLTEVDELYTAPYCGFESGGHYYAVCSTKDHVAKITIPTYVLTAADDPFIPVQDYLEASWSPAVELQIQPWGGHLGYLRWRKNAFGNRRWLDEYLVASLTSLLGKI